MIGWKVVAYAFNHSTGETTRIGPPEPTEWKKKTDSQKLSSTGALWYPCPHLPYKEQMLKKPTYITKYSI